MLDTSESKGLALFAVSLIAVYGAYLWCVVRGGRGNDRRVQNVRLVAELLMYISWTVLLAFWLLISLSAYPRSLNSEVQDSNQGLAVIGALVGAVLIVPVFLAFILPLAILLAGGRAQRIRLLGAAASFALFVLLQRGMVELIRFRDLVAYAGMLMTPIVALVDSYRRRVVAF